MKKTSSALLWGIVLIIVGALALLSNLKLLGGADNILWGIIFAGVGVAFILVFTRNREQWWALIPGLGGLGLGALLILGDLLPGEWSGVLFLAPLGLSFLVIYVLKRDFWWALIPGGTLLSCCLVVLASNQNRFDSGSLMLLGLGVTFGAVALLGKPAPRFRWAWIPAGVLFLIGILILADSVEAANYIWPLAIVAVGAVFLLRALAGKPNDDKPAAPPTPPEPPAPAA